MLGPQARRCIRAESHAQEEGGESCEKTFFFFFETLISVKNGGLLGLFRFILKNFELILRTVNILCILFNPPMVAPVFPL